MNSSKFAFFSKIPLCVWALIIFAVAVGARFYWVAQKEDFFLDEITSLQITSVQSWAVPELKAGKIYTAREVRQAAFGNAADNSDLGDDLSRLRMHNPDKCHTNFYYSLLRVVISGCEPGFHPLLFRGFALNLFLFAGSFAIWTALFKKLFRGNDFAVCVALAAASLNAGAIAMTAFVREYELQMFWVSAFALAFVMLVEAWSKDSSRATWKSLLASWPKLLALAVVTVGALLSGYFSIVFVILATIALCAVAAKSRGAKAILFPPAALALAVGIASIIYPDYFHGFFVTRGAEAAGKFNTAIILENIGNTWDGAVWILEKVFPGKACGAALILFLAVLVGKKVFEIDAARKRSRDVPVPAAAAAPELPQERDGAKARIFATFDAFLASPTAMLLVAAFLATCAILYLAPYKTSRYVVAFYPILALVFPLVVAKLRSRGIACVAGAAFIALFAVFAFSAMKKTPPEGSWCPKVEYLVNDSSKWRSLMRKYAGSSSVIIFAQNGAHHWFPVMEIPADANVVFQKADRKAYTPVTVKAFGKKSALFLVNRSGKSDVNLPRGAVGKEIPLFGRFTTAIPLTFDESKPAHILKWRAGRGKVAQRGHLFDVVEVPEPAKSAPADAKK